jgi:pimeloyl-ACP methyl ester carboxylesterase
MLAELDGVRLFYRQSGVGDPVVLLHGNGEDSGIFDALAEKLRRHFAVFAIDSRNHGQSQRTEDISYEAMAGDSLLFIKKLDLGPVFLAGFSDGAIVALMMAMRQPEAIRKMVLMGPNMSPDDLTGEAIELIARQASEPDGRLARMLLREPHLTPGDLAKIKVPALLVFGENDIFKPGTAAAMAKALPRSALKIMPGHDHQSYVAGQDVMYQDMASFFGLRA